MQKPTLIMLTCLLIFFSCKVFAQNKNLISGDYRGVDFLQFVDSIETKYPYKFYYDSSETDSIRISLIADNFTIRQLLERALQSTGLHYAIDSLNRIFITKKFVIQTNLPDDFFVSAPLHDTAVIKDISENEQEPKTELRVSAENKLFQIGAPSGRQGKATIAGYVRYMKSGEAIIGASVYVDSPYTGVNTDRFGYFSLTLRKGYHVINTSAVGMKDTKRQVMLNNDGKLNIDMEEYVPSLKNVLVKAERTSTLRNLQMGVNIVSIKTIKQVPVVFGEADISKVVLTLPGVTSVGEASNGFNVRGGAADQNLILFNDATVYNPFHLFGFFSSFNPDMVKGIELYKSAIPEKYGGRLSSVLDVAVKDGNTKKWTGAAGLGPLTSKIYIEGPLKKEKTSVIASVRTTYSDWLLNKIPDNSAYSNSSANFYDGTMHINHTINLKNSIYFTGYLSNDRFRLKSDTLYSYSNKNANLKWKHIFNNKFYDVITAGIDHYQYSVTSTSNSVNGFKLGFDINQFNFRADFNYAPNSKHSINFGMNSIYYKLHPGYLSPEGKGSLVAPNTVEAEQAIENAIYLGDQYSISSKLSVNLGLRYSLYSYLGPHTVNTYIEGIPKDTTTIISTTNFEKGKIIKTYSAPEIRFATRYILSDNASLKLSFNSTQQFIHMLSNTTTISPTDIWKLSDPNIKPQSGYQLSIGYYQNFKSNMIETSIEAYYKQTENYLDYRSGANLVLNHHIETDVIATKGKAYGIEFLLRKNTGKLNGWFTYTYSRSLLKSDNIAAGEIVNRGEYYPASFDKPHSANFISNYQFSHRYNISLNIVYSTGRPITLPLAIFSSGGTSGLYYSDRNAYRIPDYFRTDISMNIEGNHKVKQKTHNTWSFGVYNLTGRQNVYSIYFIQENGVAKGYRLSIFGAPIPFVTYSIRF